MKEAKYRLRDVSLLNEITIVVFEMKLFFYKLLDWTLGAIEDNTTTNISLVANIKCVDL